MRITVFGASGLLGQKVCDRLDERGHDVVRASRSAGVDATSTTAVRHAVRRSSVVLDCLNIETLSGPKSVEFFETTATTITRAAHAAGVGQIYCLSIINATDPRVNSALGYYRGKAAQERIYRQAGGRVLATAQWFELAEQLAGRIRIGPVSVMPRMLTQAVAADSVAEFIVEAIEQRRSTGLEIAGPEPIRLSEVARGLDIKPLLELPVGSAVLRNGALLPAPGVHRDSVRLDSWLENRRILRHDG